MADVSELTVSDVTLAIRGGGVDEGLDKIITAVQDRMLEGVAQMRWRLTVADLGLEVTEDDLTMVMAKTVERLTGHSWGLIDPHRSAGDCSAIAVAVLHHRDGFSLSKDVKSGEWVGEAVSKVDSLPMSTFVEGLTTFQVSPAPLDRGNGTGTDPGSIVPPLSESAGSTPTS